jgi:hypothetical protein
LEVEEIDRASRDEHARAEAYIDLDDTADARTKQSLLKRARQAVRDSIKLARRNEDLPLSFQIENHLERLRDLVGDKGYVMALLVTADRERFDAIQPIDPLHQHEHEDGPASKLEYHRRWSLMVEYAADPSQIPGSHRRRK